MATYMGNVPFAVTEHGSLRPWYTSMELAGFDSSALGKARR